MEGLKEKMPIIIILLVAIVICGITICFVEFQSYTYYTKIDNTKIEKISTTDDMKYEYNLDCYNDNGKKKEIKFNTSRELRESAYLKLKVLALTGVNKWEEIQFDELPNKVQAIYNK